MADVSTAPFFTQGNPGGIDTVAVLNKGSIDPNVVVQKEAQSLRTIQAQSYLDELPKYYLQINVGQYARSQIGVQGSFDTIYSLAMPLPNQLVDHQGVIFDQTPLNPMLGNALNAVTSQVNNTAENQTKTWDDVVGRLLGGAALGGVGAVASLPIISSVVGVAGYSPNQFLTILLRGPQYKQYSFEWDLAPASSSEALNLATITTYLKNAQAPQYVAGGAFFRFPKIFWLRFVPNPGFLYKFKPAVMTNFAVNYAGGGAPIFNRSIGATAGKGGPNDAPDNPPALYKVHMKFWELEFWLQGNYNLNNNPEDVYKRDEVSFDELLEQAKAFKDAAVTTFNRARNNFNFVDNALSNPDLPPF